jgi:hypothetical protein
VKKLISIGLALALVAMVVLPIGVAAAGPEPSTFAKIPFAIVGSGFYLLQSVLQALLTAGTLPANLGWLVDLMPTLGDFAAGPLAWSVDMLAWGASALGAILAALQAALLAMGIDIGMDLSGLQALCNVIACQLLTPWAANVTGPPFAPCIS